MQSNGKIISIQDNIILAVGLNNAFLGEVVSFKTPNSDITGQILNLERNITRIVILSGKQSEIESGDSIYRTYKDVKTKVGFGVLGKLMSPLGNLINVEDYTNNDTMYSELVDLEYMPIERSAPGIIERETVRIPCATGINAVDTFIPIGCGQRELIIGDHSTGKTSFAVTAIINQKYTNLLLNKPWRDLEQDYQHFGLFNKHSKLIPCIYVGIGQKRSEIARIKKLLELSGALNYTSIIFTSSDEPASIQFIAPYAGCTIGEWFRDNGYKAIAVYDDLSQHAVAYRQMSLLLRRPPGREAYPGDVFYVHSRLLERAAQLHRNIGGGSLTALPIITTRGGDISAYIPTNVISITDGQIFLSSELSNKGIRPAINIGLSVSRVGSSAQTPTMKELSRKLKGDYAFYNTYKGIARLGGDVDPIIMSYIDRGFRIDEFFKQGLYESLSYIKQIICIYCLTAGFVDKIDRKHVDIFFNLLFNSEFTDKYLNFKLLDYINDLSDLESWLYSNALKDNPIMEDNLNKWCKSTSRFFISKIAPRLEFDVTLVNLIKNNIK